MSIAVLNQVYDEARRLAVAGSVVARGDFRLKKLLQPLEQAGTKAPVFAKVAEYAKAVIDGPEESSAESLLELTSLVTAVLYTQGETGLVGTLEPIETIDLGGATTQASARLLKPLLEALSSTGGGRLELVKDAHERGAFRDLRLIRPALDGLDDPYPEIGEFLADKVLPMFGTAILPELRKKYDAKGTKGHPRRLKLMHGLDPTGTRELVKQALENGSKEVRVAAIACLGADPEDLAFLIEQAGAKAQDVRAAAYQALAKIDDPTAVATIEKAIAGKDLDLAVRAIDRSKVERLTAMLIAEIQKSVAELPKQKDKKKISATADRLSKLIAALPPGAHAEADKITLDLFARRADLAQLKGETHSGSDLVEAVVARMAIGAKPLQEVLARSHADLDGDDLIAAFQSARYTLPPDEVYDLFAPYLETKDAAKKGKHADRRERIIVALGGVSVYWHYHRNKDQRSLDPRWLDLALRIKNLELVHAIGRPGHAATEAFVQAEFDAGMAKAKVDDKVQDAVTVMVAFQHPKAAASLVAAFEKMLAKGNINAYWLYALIPDLPTTAIPLLEAIVPKLKDRDGDQLLAAIQKLRDKQC